MLTVYTEYLGKFYHELLRDGWVHWCKHVDENNIAMLVRNINADTKDTDDKIKGSMEG